MPFTFIFNLLLHINGRLHRVIPLFSINQLSKVGLHIAVVELANVGSENTGHGTAAGDTLDSVGMPKNINRSHFMKKISDTGRTVHLIKDHSYICRRKHCQYIISILQALRFRGYQFLHEIQDHTRQ